MIPADSDDVKRDYEVLLGELTQYNPELLDNDACLPSPNATCSTRN